MTGERDHDVERFRTFADAVVAIAITLLAIPVLEHASVASDGFAAWWAGSGLPLLGLAISFAVIGRLWWAHHRVFEHLRRSNAPLIWVTFAWLFTIVLIPISTAVTTSADPREQHWTFALYLGVMILSGVLLTVQSLIVQRRPDLTDGRDTEARSRTVNNAETVVGFVLVLLIGTLFPGLSYYAFFVLVLTGRLSGLVNRRLDRRR